MKQNFFDYCNEHSWEQIANLAGWINSNDECPPPVSYREWRSRIIENAYVRVQTIQCQRFYVMGGDLWSLDEYLNRDVNKEERDLYIGITLDNFEMAWNEYDPEYGVEE